MENESFFFLSLQVYGMSGQCNSKEEKKWNENTVEPVRVQWTGSISYPSIQDAERMKKCVLCGAKTKIWKQTHTHMVAWRQPWSKNSFRLSYNLWILYSFFSCAE